MRIKEPIEYSLVPDTISTEQGWVTLSLKNRGSNELKHLDVRLNSLDQYSIDVHGTGSYLMVLRPGEEKRIPFQVTVMSRGHVYATLNGWQDGAESFFWESPPMLITAGRAAAVIERFFAMTEPYPIFGEPVTCEAVIRARAANTGMVIEFWVETPEREFKSLAKEGLGLMELGEEVHQQVTFTPDAEGIYVLHAYLYDGAQRIDHQIEYLSITR